MNEKTERFLEIIKQSKNIVFFGGAGVSTESGIPDFRSADGIYNQKYAYPPETILSHSFFVTHTKEFYDFYRDKMIFSYAKPNVVHKKLADLEASGKLLAVVTQNIDGLHEQAGSKKVYNLHGSVYSNTCMKCGKKYGIDFVANTSCVPKCKCGGIVKPDVVLYEEPLDFEVTNGAVQAIESADTLIVGGTSLTVYPAAGFLRCFSGKNLILINKQPTSYDDMADLVINEKLSDVFSEITIE